MMHRILIIDDDANLITTLRHALAFEGYEIEAAVEAETAMAALVMANFDVIVLDIGLPGEDGFAVCRRIRKRDLDTPILMLTGHSAVNDKVNGLDSGADDYLTKPFELTELLARIQALLRRPRRTQVTDYIFGDVCVNFVAGSVRRNGTTLGLSTKELQLLRYLVDRRGTTVSRAELLKEVWGYSSTSTRTVDMHIAILRQKVEHDPQQPRYILTVRNEGYEFLD
jgi:DNA-binding response OmpR family regulator